MLAFLENCDGVEPPYDDRPDSALGYLLHQPAGGEDGFHAGINIGVQNVFGGSFVNEMDILAQESKFVTEILAGYRIQFLNDRLVGGLQLQFGFLDGDLSHADAANELFIDYSTNTQWSYGATLGVTVGEDKRLLIFGISVLLRVEWLLLCLYLFLDCLFGLKRGRK